MKQLLFTYIIYSLSVLQAGVIDHSIYDQLLRKHVNSLGQVHYHGFKTDEEKLDKYLTLLAKVKNDSVSNSGLKALYINAYNAFTIKLILNHLGSIKSIRDIDNPWDSEVWTIAGETMSLNEIEHRILREKLKEPRIHFAIVCASVGCPKLWNHAYTADRIDQQLNDAAKRFIHSEKFVKLEVQKGWFGKTKIVLRISRIFDWFKKDFINDAGSVPEFILNYAPEVMRKRISANLNQVEIEYLDYDWSLNDQ